MISLTAQLKPRSDAEAAIVETMAIARWKQMRIWGIQKAGFDLEMARLNSSCNIPAARASIVFKNLADNSRVLDLQYRYETGYDRQYCRAYAFFLKLRAKPDTQIEDTEFQSAQFSSAIATWEPAPQQTPVEPPIPDAKPHRDPGPAASEEIKDWKEVQPKTTAPAKPLKPLPLPSQNVICETDPISRPDNRRRQLSLSPNRSAAEPEQGLARS